MGRREELREWFSGDKEGKKVFDRFEVRQNRCRNTRCHLIHLDATESFKPIVARKKKVYNQKMISGVGNREGLQ